MAGEKIGIHIFLSHISGQLNLSVSSPRSDESNFGMEKTHLTET